MRKKEFRHECRFIGSSRTQPKIGIEMMYDKARPVLRRTFMSHVNINDLHFVVPYCKKRMYKMAFADDPHLAYFKSWYASRVCYYITYGGVMYIFIDEELL